MSRVYLSFDDLGLGIQFVDALESAGHAVAWPRTPADVPPEDLEVPPDVVILGANGSDVLVGKWANGWRSLDPPPGIVLLTQDDRGRHIAESVRATALSTQGADTNALLAAVPRAIQLRYAGELTMRFARHATGVEGTGSELDQALRVMSAARRLDSPLIREALRPRIYDYVSTTDLLDHLLGARCLELKEGKLATELDGTTTLRYAIDSGGMEPAEAARLLWSLICVGAARLTVEPPDLSTTKRRAVTRARIHLRERRRRLRRGKANYYEVLEVRYDPTRAELDDAVRRLAIRYSPKALAALDLGDLEPVVEPLWNQIQKAWRMLADPRSRQRYHEWLQSSGVDVAKIARERSGDPVGAEGDFDAGQRALSRGEVFKAVSFFAAAARRNPTQPDYEAYLAWARYRAALEKGEDKAEVALRERSLIEAEQTGRGPRPRALLALGMLCAACEDSAAGRWYLREALVCDPDFGPARNILSRLGG